MNLNPQIIPVQALEREKIFQWIVELGHQEMRENALLELRFVFLFRNVKILIIFIFFDLLS